MRRAVILSIIDQAMISAFNLVLNLAFIAYATPSEFGRFALVIAASFFVTSGQNALVVMPLNFLLPGRPQVEADAQLSMLTSANLVLTAIVIPVSIALGAMIGADLILTLSILGYFLTIIVREFVRNLMVVTGRVDRTLIYDVSAIIASAALTVTFWTFLAPEAAVLAGMTAGNLVSFAFGRFDLKLNTGAFPSHLRAYGKVWKDTRWALQGALQNEVSKRSYAFLVERMRDAASLGTINAGRVALSPLLLISAAWSRVARPKLVEDLRSKNASGVAGVLWSGTAVIAGATVLYGLALIVAWPFIETAIFRNRYPGIETIVLCWWLYSLVVGVASVASTLMEAQRQFRELAAVGLAGAIVIPIVIFALLAAQLGNVAVVLALGGVQVVELFACMYFLTRAPKALSGEPATVASP